MKKLVWRLADRPTALEVMQLVDHGLISKEEAREILFKEEDDVGKDFTSSGTTVTYTGQSTQK